MTVQMGRAISILAKSVAEEEMLHMDVNEFGAPSECHELVSKGEAQRLRTARRHAIAASGLTKNEFNQRLRELPYGTIDRVVGIILDRDCPFI